MEKKKCIKCELEKYLSSFEFRKDRNKYRNTCKDCQRTRHRVLDKVRYDSMTLEQKKEHISRKSLGNKNRLKSSPEALAAKRRYDKSDRGIYARYRNDANRRSRKFDFELTFSEFVSLINSSCFYCGKENCRGVDRYDSSLGYTVENAVPCCGRCNEIKNDATVKELYRHLAKMVKHFKDNKEMILR